MSREATKVRGGAATEPRKRHAATDGNGSGASPVDRMRAENAGRPIGRILPPSPRRFDRQFVRTGDPVIVQGALDRWPALGKWSPDHFASEWGRVEVEVDGERFPMAELVARIRAPDVIAPYLRSCAVEDLAPGLLCDLEPDPPLMGPNWLDGRFIPRRFSIRDDLRSGMRWRLRFGEAGSTFPVLHWDVNHYHAYVAQLYGEKAVVVYPPDQAEHLYPDDAHPNRSRIPVGDEFDPEEFPAFREARGASATLRPGDLLFLPAGWWHAVENTSVSIAVTANTATAANWPDVVRDVTSGRGSPLRRRAVAAYLHGVGLLRSALEA